MKLKIVSLILAANLIVSLPGYTSVNGNEWFNYLSKSGTNTIPEINRELNQEPEINELFFDFYYNYISRGISVRVEKASKKITTIFFFAKNSSGIHTKYSRYNGTLPLNLTLDDSKDTVLRKLGQPVKQEDNLLTFEKDYSTIAISFLEGKIEYVRINRSQAQEVAKAASEHKNMVVNQYSPFDHVILKNDGKADGNKMIWEMEDGPPYIYEGSWKTGLAEGYGVLQNGSELRYEGNWQKGKFHGKGKLIVNIGDLKYNYEGEFEHGVVSGKGILTANGETYSGNFVKGQLHGYGKAAYADETSYEGEFKAGRREGKGTGYIKDFKMYEGEWKAGFPDGTGTEYMLNNDKYVGKFKAGKKEGYGTYYSFTEKVKVTGNSVNDKLEGNCNVYDLNDKKIGVFYFENGKPVRKVN